MSKFQWCIYYTNTACCQELRPILYTEVHTVPTWVLLLGCYNAPMKRAGMDEVGRAAFAGPLVAAVCKLKTTTTKKQIKALLGALLRDSKTLSDPQKDKVINSIGKLVRFKITAITVDEINQYGLGWANIEIMRRLSRILPAKKYIVDGNMKFGEGFEKMVSKVKADTKVVEVMLAAIIAKVHRDAYMAKLHQEFPFYCWDTNAGYGTKAHREAILAHGLCHHHRLKFVESYLIGLNLYKSKRKEDNIKHGRRQASSKLSSKKP